MRKVILFSLLLLVELVCGSPTLKRNEKNTALKLNTIQCTNPIKSHDSDKHGLIFAFRGHHNPQVLKQIKLAASKITQNAPPGVLDELALTMFVNGDTQFLFTVYEANYFIREIDETSDRWQNSSAKVDTVLEAIQESLDLSTAKKYQKTPIFLFTDVPPKDDASAEIDVLNRVSELHTPIFTIFYGADSQKSPGYGKLQSLAQYSQGLTVQVTPDQISEAAAALASSYFDSNVLAGHDLLATCQQAPLKHKFTVDDSVKAISVASVGPLDVFVHVVNSNGETVEPELNSTVGDLQLTQYHSLAKGTYQLELETNAETAPCVYRVYAQSKAQAWFGTTDESTSDLTGYQLVFNKNIGLVGRISQVEINPDNVNAKLTIWEGDNTVNQRDNRKVLHKTTGTFRNNCLFNLYFGEWKCTKHGQLLNVDIEIKDKNGNEVKRTTTTWCATKEKESGEPCKNGGSLHSNKCLCTDDWTGIQCQTAVCHNGGQPRGDYCSCSAGFGGDHCEQRLCSSQNTKVDFKPGNVTVAIIVQNSKDLLATLLGLSNVAPQLVGELQDNIPKGWINLLSFWEFDNKEYDFATKTPFFDDIPIEVKEFIDKRRSKEYICKDLKVLEVLIAALTDRDAQPGIEIYLFVHGGIKRDVAKQGLLYGLIDQLGAKIHVIQSSINRCYSDLEDPDITTLAAIAHYSSGTYTASGAGSSLLALPLQYDTATVLDEFADTCNGKQLYAFPIDSETQTISLRIHGDLNSEPVAILPNGKIFKPTNVYSGSEDSLYVVDRNNAQIDSEGNLPSGQWKVGFGIYSKGDLPCGLKVDVQSSLQVHRRFTEDSSADDGSNFLTHGSEKTRQIAHVESALGKKNGKQAKLESAELYDVEGVLSFSKREHCSFEWVSDSFTVTNFFYITKYTGFDSNGQPFQRISHAISVADPPIACKNGGQRTANGRNCACSNDFKGNDCSEPVCQHGKLSGNRTSCVCDAEFSGDRCQLVSCASEDGPLPPTDQSNGQTFTLILDGSFTGQNKKFLTDFKRILDQTFSGLANIENRWFKNYVGIVAYDQEHGSSTSEVISKGNRLDFEVAINELLSEKYVTTSRERNFIRSVLKVLVSDQVLPGSPIYIVTDSAIKDVDSFKENLNNMLAYKKVTISTIILGDQTIPGGRSSYSDASVQAFIQLALTTGGGFYQVRDADSLAGFWTAQLASNFQGSSILQSFHPKCANRTEEIQIGPNSNINVDIFSPLKTSIRLFDPDNNLVRVIRVRSSKTNTLFAIETQKAGTWKLEVDDSNPAPCFLAIRSIRKDPPAIAFNTDVSNDRGYHSQGAANSPVSGKKNSIIANSKSDTLQNVRILTNEGVLVSKQRLIQRSSECHWNYVSESLIDCPSATFKVVVEGVDSAGYPIKRIQNTHCLNWEYE